MARKAVSIRPDKRDKTVYRAHELRHGIVHAFPDAGVQEMSVLLGETALEPGTEGHYSFVYPAHERRDPPEVRLRFVPRERFAAFIDCRPDAPAVPPEFDGYEEPKLETGLTQQTVTLTDDRPGRWVDNWARWLCLPATAKPGRDVEVKTLEIDFATSANEGVYVFEIDTGVQPVGPWNGAPCERFVEYVFVYSKPQTRFPAPGVEDIAELLVDGVNLSRKNGWIWFVHPIYFAEQLLRVELSQETKEEIAHCEDLPEDLPADDEALTFLQWGRDLAGMQRVCLELDGPSDECLDTEAMKVVPDAPLDLAELVKGGSQ